MTRVVISLPPSFCRRAGQRAQPSLGHSVLGVSARSWRLTWISHQADSTRNGVFIWRGGQPLPALSSLSRRAWARSGQGGRASGEKLSLGIVTFPASAPALGIFDQQSAGWVGIFSNRRDHVDKPEHTCLSFRLPLRTLARSKSPHICPLQSSYRTGRRRSRWGGKSHAYPI